MPSFFKSNFSFLKPSSCLIQIFIDDLIFTATAVAALTPMLEQSKLFMDPTGGEMIDKMISEIPNITNAFGNNDLTTIHRMLRETQKLMDTVVMLHITHAQFRELAAERMDAFNSIVDCIHQGKCGFRAYIHYLCGCVKPMKQIYTY